MNRPACASLTGAIGNTPLVELHRLNPADGRVQLYGKLESSNPGGSIKDAEVIAAADEAGLAMVFTGMRHFRH